MRLGSRSWAQAVKAVSEHLLRLKNDMIYSAGADSPTAEPIPYGVARSLRKEMAEAQRDWYYTRRRGDPIAHCNGKQINLSTKPWRAHSRNVSLDLRFQLAADDAMLISAREVLERSHPHRSPPSGIYLICTFADRAQQQDIFARKKKARRRDDPWSSAWRSDPTPVVGCVVLSRLFHGNPRGRAEIMKDCGAWFEPSAKRSDVVNGLGLAWVSRIAVDAPYRGLNIGTYLLAEARQSAAGRLPWNPKYLEVIRTVLDRDAEDKEDSGGDFITRAGYKRAAEQARCAPIRPINADGRRSVHTEHCTRFYYWCRCS